MKSTGAWVFSGQLHEPETGACGATNQDHISCKPCFSAPPASLGDDRYSGASAPTGDRS